MRDVEQQDSETSGLLGKQASGAADEKPKRRAVALTIVVALCAASALVNLVPSGRGGGLRGTRLEAAGDDDAASPAVPAAAGGSLQEKFAAAFQSILDEEATAWDCAFSVAVKTETESAALVRRRHVRR